MSKDTTLRARALLAAAAFLSFGIAACTRPPDADLPATVTDAVGALAAECTGAEGKPHTEKAVERADLNGDGRDDFVLHAGWIACENAWSIYGDREKFVAVYAGDG